ncbi:MAG: TonB-dependent receptor, partial [Bacteroidales bacterium]|nr:TonB-dependent receptor [Bacteroidales bacterium]
MRQFYFITVLLVLGFQGFTQSVLIGTVLDADTRESVVGATVYDAKTKTGTVTNFEGRFRLNAANGTEVAVSSMGYQSQTVVLTVGEDIVILLVPQALTIKGAEIIANVAIARRTPVAVSSITPIQITEKLGTQEFVEVLKATPGVYTTKMGGGFGDSRITLRGFASENVAVMVNGVPMNDMEHGGVFWSNWAGLPDVTRSIQVQRGLGASKVSAPSVGGSINILTRTTDALKGGFFSYGTGSDGYNKVVFTMSTGLTDDGWAISMLGSKTWGDGYVQGTNFEGYSYFLNVSKQFNPRHLLSFTGFGAPQTHYMRNRFDRLFIAEWEKFPEKYRFNPSYGYDMDGKRRTQDYNFYHKPQLSLNHYWTINEKSSLSTALYTSIGRGGGYGARGRPAIQNQRLFGASNGLVNMTYRTLYNYFDYSALMQENAADPNGSSAIISSSINNHNWVGLLSTYTSKLTDEIDYYVGVDFRYYEGLHENRIADLMGGRFFIDPARLSANYRNPERNTFNYQNERLKTGDIVFRDWTGYIVQGGTFGQLEYNKDKLSAFTSLAVSNNTYWRVDRFYYDNEKSDVRHFMGYVAKGGANYNLTGNHNVFANIGHISKAPFLQGGVFAGTGNTSNNMNPDPKNEKIFSKEIGYGYHSQYISANVNVYHTNWNDKSIVNAIDENPAIGVVNIQGVNALHQGIEIDFTAKPTDQLEFRGMLSVGDWKWTSNASGFAYDGNGQPVDNLGNVVAPNSPNHMKVEFNNKGIFVGGSAQITANLGFTFQFLNDFRVGMDYIYYDKNYAQNFRANFNEMLN